MPQSTLFRRLVPKNAPASAAIRKRIEDASRAVQDAEREWRLAAVAVEAGDETADEASAEAGLAKAKRELFRLEGILSEVQAAEHDEGRRAQLASEAAQDALVVDALNDQTKAASALETAVAGYVKAWEGLVAANGNAVGLALTNPRARQDLLLQSVRHLVGVEITRQAGGRTLPPGGNAWSAASVDPRTLPPMVAHFDALKSAIFNRTLVDA